MDRGALSLMISSPLLHTLHFHYVDITELEMIERQCPTLQHLSIYEFDDTEQRDMGASIAKMTKLKSLIIDFGEENVPLYLMRSAPQSSWLQLKSLIHLQRLTIKGHKHSLESFPQLIELVQYLSNSTHQSAPSGDDNATIVSVVESNGSLQQMNDMSCHEWLSMNDWCDD
jgi:hypothetical protein